MLPKHRLTRKVGRGCPQPATCNLRPATFLCSLLTFLLVVLRTTPAFAQTDTNAAPGTEAAEADSTLSLANRRICVFRATLDGYSPQERAAAAAARLDWVLSQAKTMLVNTQAVPAGILISLDGKGLFVLTSNDVSTIRGQTLDAKVVVVTSELRAALHDIHSLSNVSELLFAIGRALFGFVLFGTLLWAARRAKRWTLARLTRFVATKTRKVNLLGFRQAGLRSFYIVLRAILTFSTYMFIAFLVYALLWYELRSFPYSRPWGDYLRSKCIELFASFGGEVMDAVPDLMVLAVIVLVARMFAQVLGRVLSAVEKGELQTRVLDPVTAATTRHLLVFLTWVVAIVVAYPYIPGSQTPAFKGITVFAGLVISLGSSSLFNQVASGLLLIYSRTFRVGDYVKVGEVEGTVTSVGLCLTRIRTIKNEEVHLANNLLLGAATTNYSKLARADGLYLPAKITIGYNTPWRQVHAMLLEAARRTRGLLWQPEPYILQTSLSDFYVEYELNVRLENPERRAWVQSELHSHIQDVFNEHGVQIMSPHYLGDPPHPHIVPKSDWYLPPAVSQENGADSPVSPALRSAAAVAQPSRPS